MGEVNGEMWAIEANSSNGELKSGMHLDTMYQCIIL
jgi:hypothetical protein